MKTIYKKAPVLEAVIDIGVVLPSNFDVKDFLKIMPEKTGIYQTGKEVFNLQGQFGILPTGATTSNTNKELIGYHFVNEDSKSILYCRKNGFAFNKLKPYDTWKPFREEAYRLWIKYRQLFQPEKITRIGIRYVNRLEIPTPILDFKEYLLTYPEVAPQLPQGLSSCFMRLEAPYPEVKAILITTLASTPSPSNEIAYIVLDSDLIRFSEIPQSDLEIWSLIDNLHSQHDLIFNSNVTEKYKELIR